MKIKLVQAEEAALEYFELVGPGWEQFEQTQTGDIVIAGVLFSMRVGLYLNKPTQAIIALNKFVKIRPYTGDPKRSDSHKGLIKLDPAFPDDAWYGRAGAGYLYAQNLGWWSPTLTPTKVPRQKLKPQFDTSIMDAAPYYNNLGKKK